MTEAKKCSFYGCEDEALEEEPRGLCIRHREKQKYTVKEAAAIWNANERTVRHWINPQHIVAAERQGRRSWLIPFEEFLKPHPTDRPHSAEPRQKAPFERFSKLKRRTLWPAAVGAALIFLLVGIGAATVINRSSLSTNLEDGRPSRFQFMIDDRVAVTAGGDGIPIYALPPTDSEQEELGRMASGFEGVIAGGPAFSGESRWWLIEWVEVGDRQLTGWSQEELPDGTVSFLPLPGKGIFPDVEDANLRYGVEVYQDAGPDGLPVRKAPGLDQPIEARVQVGEVGLTNGAPVIIDEFIWWWVTFGEGGNGVSGWVRDSGLPQGVFLVKTGAVSTDKVTLTLYVREKSATDPVVPGAQVTVRDGGDEVLDYSTNIHGFVTITGVPGEWTFKISAPGFLDNCWSDDISSSKTKHAFFIDEDTCAGE